jgi:hypothetical protein
MRLILLAFALAVVLAAPAVAEWRRPVAGEVTRPFAYGPDFFRAGWHRGVDLAAPAGATVRAACTGRVATARPGLVTLRCGPWRVTHLPLAAVSVRRGEAVTAGRPIGTLGSGSGAGFGSRAGSGSSAGTRHAGLHLGVRRAGERFGYVDPLPLLRGSPPSPPVAAPRRVPRAGPRPGRPPAPLAEPRRAPRPVPVPAEVRVFRPAAARALAPWPAWAGLALLALGAAGSGVRIGLRRRRAHVRTPVPSAP